MWFSVNSPTGSALRDHIRRAAKPCDKFCGVPTGAEYRPLDHVADILAGGSDQDWFVADQTGTISDLIIDKLAIEIVDDLGGLP